MDQQTVTDLPQEILTRIDALTATLGTTVEQLWPAMVAAVRYEAVADASIGGATLAVLAILVAHFARISSRYERAGMEKESSEAATGAVAFLVATAGAFLCFCIEGGGVVANILAPEAHAIRHLAEALG